MIAVFSGNSNTQRLICDGSGVQLFAFCSERDSHFASLKNGTRVRDECGARAAEKAL
jgi:hypothetical protein